MSKHPIQPLALDAQGTMRFKPNKIVQYLLDNGGIDLNHLARQEFTQDDREQFAQLIGYSLCGFGTLSYVSDETYNAAELMSKAGVSSDEARAIELRKRLDAIKVGMKDAVGKLYGIHPDDLIDGHG